MKATSPRCVIAAGSTIETALLPGRLLALRKDYDLEMAVAVSARALDLVALPALQAISAREVYRESAQFDQATGYPMHMALAQTELLVLHPASARILVECALGSVTCAVTRLFAFTPRERILVAPAVHPNMEQSIYEGHLATLRGFGCTVLGGEDMHAEWPAIERAIVARLGIERQGSARDVIRLDRLGED